MKIPFWSYDQSPLTDPPTLWLKPKDAQERVEKGYVHTCAGGVQQRAPIGYTSDARNKATAGTMREAWQIRESAGYLVLQLNTA